ncbi:MAG: hypothetical protein LWX07_12845 [Bacteroidetes bacterium]|nr:hypothetical protein [Bacteroidota bacterium]
MSNNLNIYENLYQLGYNFLSNQIKSSTIDLDKYLMPAAKAESLNDIFYRILISSINMQGNQNIIRFPNHEQFDIEPLREILFDFDPHKVYANYKNISYENLLTIIQRNQNLEEINMGDRWLNFCKTIHTSACYLSSFKDYEDCKHVFDDIYNSSYSKNFLPILFQHKIYGFGIALSCDCLKEIGYTKYGKPDSHIKNLFRGINLLENNKYGEDFECLFIFDDLAKYSGKSQYAIDKIFWLIGTGYFYLDNIRRNRSMNEFIELAKKEFKIE